MKRYKKFQYQHWTAKNGLLNNYNDFRGHIDSINQNSIQNEESDDITKEFDRKGRLLSETNANKEKKEYQYGWGSKLKKINFYKGSRLYEQNTYKKGMLVSNGYMIRGKVSRKTVFKYNDKGFITKKDNGHHYYNYYYTNDKISKVEKVYNKKNTMIKYFTFQYNTRGMLIGKREFSRTHKLKNRYTYVYPNITTNELATNSK